MDTFGHRLLITLVIHPLDTSPEYCKLSEIVGGAICDDRISLREMQFRIILPMAWIPIMLTTGPNQRSCQCHIIITTRRAKI